MQCFSVIGHCHEVQGYVSIPSKVPYAYDVSFQINSALQMCRSRNILFRPLVNVFKGSYTIKYFCSSPLKFLIDGLLLGRVLV